MRSRDLCPPLPPWAGRVRRAVRSHRQAAGSTAQTPPAFRVRSRVDGPDRTRLPNSARPERPIEERVAEVSPCRAVLAAERGPVRSGSRDHERAPVSERGHEHARVARRNDHDAILRPARIEHLPQFNWGESVFAMPRNDGEPIRATMRRKNDNQNVLVAVHRRSSRPQARGHGACGGKCAALAVETDNRFDRRSEPRLQNPRCSPRFAFKNAFWPKQSEGDDVGVAEALTRTWDRLRGYSAPDVNGKRRSRGAKHRAPSQ